MKRFHVHLGVENLERSVDFYSRLFAAEPSVLKPDYAKWMLDDPRVNFAISSGGHASPGVEHLGVQVEDTEELADVYGRLKTANGPVVEEGETTCCYAKSEKSWIADPDGVVWEAFLTHGDATVYGDNAPIDQLASDTAAAGQCCTPAALDAAPEPVKCCG